MSPLFTTIFTPLIAFARKKTKTDSLMHSSLLSGASVAEFGFLQLLFAFVTVPSCLLIVSLSYINQVERSLPFLFGALVNPTQLKWNHSLGQESPSHPTISP